MAGGNVSSVLQMIFRTVKQGDAPKQTERELSGLEKKFGAIKGVLAGTTAAFAAVGTAVVVLKKGWEFGKEGAELLAVQGKFDNLTASIGTTSDALLGDLREATRGMLTDAELVASATDIMSLGLAKNHDDVVRLSRVASGLGMDMNQLVLTLTNQTTMRFDALGVKVDGFDAKVQALKATGLSAEEAFGEAFLQQAEAQLALVGERADTDAGAIQQMEVAVKNLGDELKVGLAPAVAAVARAITDMIRGTEDEEEAINKHASGVDLLTTTYDDYLKKLQEVAGEQGYTVTEIDGALRMFNSSGMDVTYMLQGFSSSAYDADQHLSNLAKQYRDTAPAAKDYAGATADAAGATADAAGAQQDLNGALLDAQSVMKDYSKELLFKIASEGLNEQAALDLAFAMGLVDDKTAFATIKVDELTTKYDLNKNGAIDAGKEAALYAGAVRALADEIARLEDKTVELTVHVSATGNLTALGAVAKGTAGQVIYGSDTEQHAAGGIIGPGELGTVGEQGWELVEGLPGGGARVYSNSQSSKMSRGGDVYLTQNIFPTAGMDEYALMRAATMQANAMRRARARAGGASVE